MPLMILLTKGRLAGMANHEPSGDQLADAIRAIKERSPDFGIKRVHAELKQSRGW